MSLPEPWIDFAVSRQIRRRKPRPITGSRHCRCAAPAIKACRCSIALVRHNVKEEDHAFADVEKESDGTRTPKIALANTLARYGIFQNSLFNMQITATSFPVLCHATYSLAAEYLAAEETDARIRQLFPSRWAFPTVCLFHQHVKEFRQSNQL
jgi:hypothetical protein